MNAFWRDEPLDNKEQDLLEALFEGHSAAAKRQNISSVVLQAAYQGSGDFNKAVAAAICTLGGMHAPITQAYDVLSGDTGVDYYEYRGEKTPGWGNSFVKGEPDDIWDRVSDLINLWPKMAKRIDRITDVLHKLERIVYPNAACYTAAAAIITEMPKEISPMLVHCARIETWAELIYDITRETPKV